MATEDIVVRYRAEVDQLEKELDILILKQDEIVKGEKAVNQQTQKSVTAEQLALNKRKELIKLEAAEIKKLAQLKKLAFDPKLIEDYNRRIQASQRNIATLRGETSKFATSTSAIFSGIGAGIAAAFSVAAIQQFASASIDAFLEAEENANKLAFAITAIGNEGGDAVERLLAQSEKLQKITIFSDDAIQQAQTALATFGLTSQQISELIPKLADFATVTKQDIVSAAQAVGGGLQGMGREFKRFGIEVEANKTPLENLNEITRGFTQFQGAAAKETETLVGQLKQQRNAVDDLQERVGEGLAPAWIAVKKATLEATLAIINYFKSGSVSGAIFLNDIDKAATATDEVTKRVQEQTEALEKAGFTQAEARKNALNDIKAEILERLSLRIETAKQIQLDQEADITEKQRAANRLSAIRNELNAINDLIAADKSRVELDEKALTLAGVRNLSTEELNRLLRENARLNDIISQSNVRLLEAEIERRKKLADVRKAGSAEEIAAVKAISAEYRDLFELLDQNGKKQLIDLWIESTKGAQDFRQAVAEATKEMQKAVQVPDQLSIPSDRQDVTPVDPLAGVAEQTEVSAAQILQATTDLLSSLTALQNQYYQNQIDQIQRTRDFELEMLKQREDSVNENLEKRRISEFEAQRANEEIQQQRIDTEKKAAAEERRIKRKQAELNKAAALIEIAINTAIATSEAYAQGGPIGGVALAAIVAAAGAAQLALVAAQPIPYRKGSKDTGPRPHLAIVGEEGPELVYMPAHSKVLPARQTKQHSQMIDAMFDGKDYGYITPKLMAQRQSQQEDRDKSFAENVTRSLFINQGGTSLQPLLKELRDNGIWISNLDELKQDNKRSIYR